MPIQDNLHGALLISAIDFILSFVVIGGIGVILSLFPLLNRFGKQGNAAALTTPQEQTALKESGSAAASPTTSPQAQSAARSGIHPGLSDQDLVVLLTAAACAALGEPVRVVKLRLRSLNAKNGNWAAQGRHALQSHRLK